MKLETDEERFERHMAHFGKNKKWNKTIQKGVDMARAVINRQPAPTISSIQKLSLKARPFENQSRYHIFDDEILPPSQDDITQVLLETVIKFGDVPFVVPELAAVQLEWVGLRKQVGNVQEVTTTRSTFKAMVEDCTQNLTMIHFHGGGFFQSDPKPHRAWNAELASLTGGCVASVRYRLAPQYQLPTQLLDAFLVYLSLIYPPKDSHRTPIDPSRIVLIGDSGGGQLSHGLLHIVKAINESKKSFQFHEHLIQPPIPYPAGSAIMSAVGDLLQALPSHRKNAVNDIYPPETPWSYPYYPPCDLWPANPPRPHLFCEMEAFKNPLFTPALMKGWVGLPPIWFGIGEDQFYDGGKAVARRAAKDGVKVTWLEFEAMPHCFPMFAGFSKTPHTRLFMKRWAEFCVDCVNGTIASRSEKVIASRIGFADLKEHEILLEQPTDPSFEEIEQLLDSKRQQDEKEFNEAWSAFRASKL